MKKILFPALALAVLGTFTLVSSCKQDVSDRFEYVMADDTIAPVITLSVPAMNQTYQYGNHVAIVGTITDLESEKNDIHDPGFRKGQLKKVSILVEDITHGETLLVRNPVVTGLDGYAINERVEIISGSGTTDCKLTITVTDGNNKTVREEVDFTYN